MKWSLITMINDERRVERWKFQTGSGRSYLSGSIFEQLLSKQHLRSTGIPLIVASANASKERSANGCLK